MNEIQPSVPVDKSDIAAVRDCLESGWLTMGPRTQKFEEELKAKTGAAHAVAVASDFAAALLSYRAAGVQPGDEVIVSALAPIWVAEAARQLGGKVVLCDSESPNRPGIDIAALKQAFTPKTKAVVVSHLWGFSDQIDEVHALCSSQQVQVIEDAAEAMLAQTESGQMAGSTGRIGWFSLSGRAQISIGEGAVVVTDDSDCAAEIRSLRSHAMTSVTWERHRGHGLGYDITEVGFNFRIDEPRAALALNKLGRLEDEVRRRRDLANRLCQSLASVPDITVLCDGNQIDRASPVAVAVVVEDGQRRDQLHRRLVDAGYLAWRPISLVGGAGLGEGQDLQRADAIGTCGLLLGLDHELERRIADLPAVFGKA